MRQVRLVILAGIGILALCGVAVGASLVDYVSHPGVAVAHVPPVMGPGAPDPVVTAPAPAPFPSTPVTSVPVDVSTSTTPPARPPEERPVTAAVQRDTLDRLLQQLLQQRRRRLPSGG